ncbi:MAG: type II secretion system protein M, partial [Halothiobacillaceae bacterium]
MKALQTWWAGMSARDRRILLIGALIALPLLGWALVWQPLEAAREAARTALAETAAQHAEVRTLARQL